MSVLGGKETCLETRVKWVSISPEMAATMTTVEGIHLRTEYCLLLGPSIGARPDKKSEFPEVLVIFWQGI